MTVILVEVLLLQETSFLSYRCVKKCSRMLQNPSNSLILEKYKGEHNMHCTLAAGKFFDVYVCVRQLQ